MPKIDIVNAKNIIESNPEKAFFKLKNTGGPKGDTGAQGPQGPKGDTGPQGAPGASASVTVGSTTTLSPGADATVTNSGDTRNAILNFGIPTGAQGPKGDTGAKGDTGPMGPKGAKGDTGAAATVQVGNTNTGAPGTNAQVTNAGNEHFAVFNFTIPRGDKGETGSTGAQGPKGDTGAAGQAATITVGSTTTTNPGTNATVTNSGTTSAAVLNFGIPRGATGSVKSDVVAELPETGEEDTFYLVNREATEQTATGKAINFTNSDNSGDITDFQLDGETSQNGTPTPSAPVAVNTTTGENVVKICGKNLFELYIGNGATNTLNGITATYNFGEQTITFNGTCTANNTGFLISDNSNDFIAGQTTSSAHWVSGSVSGYCQLRHFDVNYGPSSINYSISTIGANNPVISQTAAATFTSLVARQSIRFDSGSVANNLKIKIMVANTTDTTYEPYQDQSYPISLGSIELCKIGDYQDYIYKSGSEWKKHSAIGKVTLDGTESGWTKPSTNRFNIDNYVTGYTKDTGKIISLCSQYPTLNSTGDNGSFNSIASSRSYALNFNSNQSFNTVRFKNTDYDNLDNFKTALGTNPVTVYYALATPTDTEITNATLITQLDNVASAPLYTGVNNITTITPNEQGTLEIKYVTYDKYNQNKVYIWNDTLQQWQIIVP